MKILISLLFVLLWNVSTLADELKLSYLEIKEFKSQHYSLLLKVAIKEKERLPISVILPKECSLTTPQTNQSINDIHLQIWNMKCDNGIVEKPVQLKGLKATKTEALLRIELLSGTSHSILLNSAEPSYIIPKEASSLQIIQTYSWLGITHILLGFDHLLFVFALLLIVKNMRRLLLTVTAFTLAHSITMIIATLGIVQVPQAPVEAVIALSILFLAMEIMHQRGEEKKVQSLSLTARYPWLIAFIFGLLHGFGFAGALAEIGLPQHAITLALIFFNIGVELGQLMFIATFVITVVLMQRLNYPSLVNKLQITLVYVMGSLSSFWLIERTLSF
ncbi:MAG: membrane protein, putative [uncultured Sulfurovum sp.]|uniref:Membrane protein, putative n=1 Tax=uncultured Sulfurovum sp. TaxID=269237 RepID=A0A6S6T1T0_9BACT|nr:MAG: membrane protein, putative [uncultured Sulfurovum sp.]